MKRRSERRVLLLLAALLLALASPAGAERAVLVEPLDARVVRTFLPGLGFRVVLAVSPVGCSSGTPGDCYRFGVVALRSRPGETVPTVLEAGSGGSLEGDVEVRLLPVAESVGGEPEAAVRAVWDGVSSAPVYVDLGQAADLDRRLRDGALVEIRANDVKESGLLRTVPTGEGQVSRVAVAYRPPDEVAPVRSIFSVVDRALAGNVRSLIGEGRATPVVFLDEPAPASRESIVVEPLRVSFASPGRPGPAGLANVPRVQPVRVPAAECGGSKESEEDVVTGKVDCFELVYGYVSYEAGEPPVIHVPTPDPADRSEAPITGSLDLRILPVDLDRPVAEVFATWDGSRTTRRLLPEAGAGTGADTVPHELPVLRVPADEIRRLDPEAARQGGVPAIVLASHPDPVRPGPDGSLMAEEAFYAPLKRDFLARQEVANRLDTVAVPVLFELDNGGFDGREVIFLEPLNASRLKVPGLPNFELPLVESVEHPELGPVYEFAVAYGVYGDEDVRLHHVGDENAPLEGDLAVVVAGLDDSSVTVRRTWSASGLGTARLAVDLAGAGGQSLRAARVQIRRADVRKALPKLPGSELVVGSVRGEHVTGAEVSSGFFNSQKRVAADRRNAGNLLDVAPTPVLFR